MKESSLRMFVLLIHFNTHLLHLHRRSVNTSSQIEEHEHSPTPRPQAVHWEEMPLDCGVFPMFERPSAEWRESRVWWKVTQHHHRWKTWVNHGEPFFGRWSCYQCDLYRWESTRTWHDHDKADGADGGGHDTFPLLCPCCKPWTTPSHSGCQ